MLNILHVYDRAPELQGRPVLVSDLVITSDASLMHFNPVHKEFICGLISRRPPALLYTYCKAKAQRHPSEKISETRAA